ncbi:MAG: carboxypeptidase-like regulatory domain-containing protein [Ignavibacteriales bacterium]|nr:carboxypeptidase-like regulatory domain-containing protein [Ignavibacteriales bacterium]
MLTGATIFAIQGNKGVVSDVYGYYALSLPPGTYTLTFSFVGYEVLEKEIRLTGNLVMNISLQPVQEELGEVVVRAGKAEQNILAPAMSLQKVDSKTIRKIPSFAGGDRSGQGDPADAGGADDQ